MRRRRAMRHGTRHLAGRVSEQRRRPSGQPRRNALTAPTTTSPALSLPLQGSVGSGGGNVLDDVRLVKRRLIALGFSWLSEDTSVNQATIRAIRLFQAITQGFQRVEGAGVDGLVEAGGNTHRWLEASNAPPRRLLPAGGAPRDGLRHIRVLRQTGDDHDWGTEWLAHTITAGRNPQPTGGLSPHPASPPVTRKAPPQPPGGPTPRHQT